MEIIDQNRRSFITQATIAVLSVPLLIGCKGSSFAAGPGGSVLEKIKRNARPLGAEGIGAIEVPADVSWKTVFDVKADDGERMIISGTVFKPDGKTPAPNTLIYFYHTDKFGIYGRAGQPKHGRYRGWLLTDENGRYEFTSIRPASYPNSTQSQHVHMTVTGLDHKEDWIDSILFEDDRFLTARERESTGKRGGFNPIVRLEKDPGGIARAVRNIRL